jgi:hypothetical protein
MNTITLKPAKDKSLARRHPWIYESAIEHVEGKSAPASGASTKLSPSITRFSSGVYNERSRTGKRWCATPAPHG